MGFGEFQLDKIDKTLQELSSAKARVVDSANVGVGLDFFLELKVFVSLQLELALVRVSLRDDISFHLWLGLVVENRHWILCSCPDRGGVALVLQTLSEFAGGAFGLLAHFISLAGSFKTYEPLF